MLMPNIRQDEIHVYHDDHHWRARGVLGDYGIADKKNKAVEFALDASATAFHGKARVVIYDVKGNVQMTITTVRQKGSPQWFQDSVP